MGVVGRMRGALDDSHASVRQPRIQRGRVQGKRSRAGRAEDLEDGHRHAGKRVETRRRVIGGLELAEDRGRGGDPQWPHGIGAESGHPGVIHAHDRSHEALEQRLAISPSEVIPELRQEPGGFIGRGHVRVPWRRPLVRHNPPMAGVRSEAPSAHRPPNEWPTTSTGPPHSASTASATAATSSNSRVIE